MEIGRIELVDRARYMLARYAVERGLPLPITKLIVPAVSALETLMADKKTRCVLCPEDTAYRFSLAEVPPEYLVITRLEKPNTTPPTAFPICPQCTQLQEAEKWARINAMDPEGREILPN